MKAEWTNRDNLSIETTGQNSKAILVIDKMPKRCLECKLIWDEMNNDIVRCSNGRRLDENEDYIYKQKPSWCPLRPLPQKKEVEVNEIEDIMHAEFSVEDIYTGKYIATIRLATDKLISLGWNACLDELTQEPYGGYKTTGVESIKPIK